MTTLCCWHSCGFWRGRCNCSSWSDPQQAFEESWKNGALILSLCKFSSLKSPLNQTRLTQASKSCPALGSLGNRAAFIWKMPTETLALDASSCVPGGFNWKRTELQCLTCATASTAPGLNFTVREWIKVGKTVETYTVFTKSSSWLARGCILQFP